MDTKIKRNVNKLNEIIVCLSFNGKYFGELLFYSLNYRVV